MGPVSLTACDKCPRTVMHNCGDSDDCLPLQSLVMEGYVW